MKLNYIHISNLLQFIDVKMLRDDITNFSGHFKFKDIKSGTEFILSLPLFQINELIPRKI